MTRSINQIDSSQAGITLIQMAGILLILSIMMVPFFQMQTLVRKAQDKKEASAQVTDIADALRQFALKNGRYPLPADPRWPLTNVGAGREIVVNEATWAQDIANGVGGANRCSIATTNINCVNGARAAFGGAVTDVDNRVVIGTVPFTALGLRPTQTVDRFGSKLLYAVTYGLTQADSFRNDLGTIRLINDIGNNVDFSTPLVDDATESQSLHFVVISQGQNRRGSFPQSGGASAGCPTVNAAIERENCNNDSTFRVITKRDNLDPNNGFPVTWYRAAGQNTDDAFDDEIAFATTLNLGGWTAQNYGGTVGQTYLSYRAGGENLVVGAAAAPNWTQKQKGRGQVQVIGANNNVRADRIVTPYICSTKASSSTAVRTDLFGDACLRIRFFTEQNTQHGLSKVLTKISPKSIQSGIDEANGRYTMRAVGDASDGRVNVEGYMTTNRIESSATQTTSDQLRTNSASADGLCSSGGASRFVQGAGAVGGITLVCN